MEINKIIFELQSVLQSLGFSEFSDNKGSLKKHTFLCTVNFPNTMSHIYVYEEYKHQEDYIIKSGYKQ